jgi:Tfp pilus assembly protein PilN
MRPVNLIPKDERSGGSRAMRGGPLAYIVLGALLAALAAVTVLVVTNNQISDRKAEVTTLNVEIAAAQTRAAESAAYTQFHQVSQQRAETVANLANSRFDWEGVMRQLALILPDDIWLSNLTGTVKPGISVGGGASVALREAVPGPALQIEGCGVGQDSVAGFISSLKEMEGVTRVGLQSSELPTASEGESGGESVSASDGCQTQDFVAKFQIVVAFDAAPIPVAGEGESTEAAVAAPEAAPAEPTSSEGEASSEGEGG